jgi:hypothetical protein
MLCNICSNIHFRHIENCALIQSEPYRLPPDQREAFTSSVFYFHHKDKWALKSSADQGCHLCGMLWLNLFENVRRISTRPSPFVFARREVILRRTVVKRWIQKESGLEHWNREDWIYVYCGGACATTSSILDYQGKLHSTLKVCFSAKSCNRRLHDNA